MRTLSEASPPSAVSWPNSCPRIDWNDRISSLAIPAGRTVVIYEHSNYRGKSVTLTGDATDVRAFPYPAGGNGNWNDKISSMRVY